MNSRYQLYLLLVSWTVHTIKIISLVEVNQAILAWSLKDSVSTDLLYVLVGILFSDEMYLL